jgi:transcriptional regulator with XRE-family HTH domain
MAQPSDSKSTAAKHATGERLRLARAATGLSQASFADQIGISRPSYISYENGYREPSPDCVRAISREFQISIEWLYDGQSAVPEYSLDWDEALGFAMKLDTAMGKGGRMLGLSQIFETLARLHKTKPVERQLHLAELVNLLSGVKKGGR